MEVRIPTSINKTGSRKRTLRIIAFFCILAITVLLLVFFHPLSQLEWGNKALIFVLCSALNIILTGVPFKFINQGWQGEVVDVSVKTSTESINPTKPTDSTWYTANTVILTLKTPKGNLIIKEADKILAKHSQGSNERYGKGDYVVKIIGTDHLAHYRSATKQTRCLYCDNYVANEAQDCEKCGNGIVTFVE